MYKQFSKACQNGDLNKVKELFEKCDNHYRKYIAFETACEHGQSDIVRYFIDEKKFEASAYGNTCIVKAVFSNNLELVKFLVENRFTIHNKDDKLICNACIGGDNIELVKYLVEEGVSTDDAITDAIYYDRVKILNFLIECGVKVSDSEDLPYGGAFIDGNIDMIKPIITNFKIDPADMSDYMIMLIQNDHYSIIEYLFEEYFDTLEFFKNVKNKPLIDQVKKVANKNFMRGFTASCIESNILSEELTQERLYDSRIWRNIKSYI